MYRSILFENESRKTDEAVCYGCSVHFHAILERDDPASCGGSRMVQSMITEMLANVSFLAVQSSGPGNLLMIDECLSSIGMQAPRILKEFVRHSSLTVGDRPLGRNEISEKQVCTKCKTRGAD